MDTFPECLGLRTAADYNYDNPFDTSSVKAVVGVTRSAVKIPPAPIPTPRFQQHSPPPNAPKVIYYSSFAEWQATQLPPRVPVKCTCFLRK